MKHFTLKMQLKLGTGPIWVAFRVMIVDLSSFNVRVNSLELALGLVLRKFQLRPPENAAPALYGSQLQRRLELSQKQSQIGFFSDLLRLRMAAVEK